MSTTYPLVILESDLERWDSISDEAIARDIEDTAQEIAVIQPQIAAFATLSRIPNREQRMNQFRHDAALEEVAQRDRFIAFLRLLQDAPAKRKARLDAEAQKDQVN